jgi:uncharacterized protein
MFIDLERIFNRTGATEKIDFSFKVEDEELIPDFARVTGAVENRAGVVTLSGEARFVLSAPCDRCTEQFSREMQVPFRHTLVTSLNDDDNDDFVLVENKKLDLDSLIREDIILSLPTQLLCSEECKGLCPICGINLNIKQCACKKPVDARMAALLQLLEDDDN